MYNPSPDTKGIGYTGWRFLNQSVQTTITKSLCVRARLLVLAPVSLEYWCGEKFYGTSAQVPSLESGVPEL